MQLHVKVERVAYPKPDSDGDWFIIITDQGTAKGNMGWRPEENQRLVLDGDWQPYKGQREFRFKTAMNDVPVSAQDQLRYVCERTPGIGHAMETKIWEEWGESWIAEIQAGVIPRLNGKLYEDLRQSVETFALEKEKSEAIAWLMGKGATLTLAQKAWEEWDKGTIGIVTHNPYRLAEMPNHSFKDVDSSMRHAFAIGDSDPRRVKAGIVYAMRQLTDMGSTVVSWYELHDACSKLLDGMYSALITGCVVEMFEDGTLRGFTQTQSMSLGRDFEHERIIWEFITYQTERELA